MRKIQIDFCQWVMGGTGIGVLSFLEMVSGSSSRIFIVRRVILIGLFRKCLRITITKITI